MNCRQGARGWATKAWTRSHPDGEPIPILVDVPRPPATSRMFEREGSARSDYRFLGARIGGEGNWGERICRDVGFAMAFGERGRCRAGRNDRLNGAEVPGARR